MRQAGLTLIELVISIVVLSVSVGGVLLAFGTGFASSARPDRLLQAAAIAEAYLDEILLHPVDDPDGVSGEASRDLYDDILDYDGLSESPPADQGGAGIAGLEAYQVDVSVVPAAALGPAGSAVAAADSFRIDVRVRRGTEVDVTLNGYRARY